MLVHMDFDFWVQKNPLKMSLAVLKVSVGVVMSPGKLIIFPPTISWIRCASSFNSNILVTMFSYVTIMPARTFPFGINNIVFVPYGIRFSIICASRLISFANESPKWILLVV